MLIFCKLKIKSNEETAESGCLNLWIVQFMEMQEQSDRENKRTNRHKKAVWNSKSALGGRVNEVVG